MSKAFVQKAFEIPLYYTEYRDHFEYDEKTGEEINKPVLTARIFTHPSEKINELISNGWVIDSVLKIEKVRDNEVLLVIAHMTSDKCALA